MTIPKAFFYFPVTIGMAIFSLSSCKNTWSSVPPMPPPIAYKLPVTQPLTYRGAKKINWDSLKSKKVHPPVEKFDINKLPVENYDSVGFKPYQPVEEKSLDFSVLAQKYLDIDKLPSKPILFKTYILPPPKVIKAGMPRLKTANDQHLFDFGAPEGLQGDIVTCLFKDRDGFLWVSTNLGIYRFDGENLLVYIPGPFSVYVVNMLQDNAGRIWMTLLDNTIQILDPASGLLKKAGKSLGVNGSNAVRIVKDKKQRIWMTTSYGGIDIIDPKTSRVQSLDNTHGLADTTAYALAVDKDQNIWISTKNGGLNMVDLRNKKISYLNSSNGLKSNVQGALFCDKDDRIWMGQIGGTISVLDLPKKTIQIIDAAEFPKTAVFGISQDNKGRIWVRKNNDGLAIVDPQQGLIKQIRERNGLAFNFVTSIVHDNQEQNWIGTVSGFNMIGDDRTILRSIGQGPTTTLTEDRLGIIWRGTNTGAIIIDRKNNTSRHLNAGHGIGNDTIETIREIDGKLLICTNSGLDIIDSSRKTVTHLNTKNGLNGNLVNAVTIDNKGRIWIGETADGIDIYDPKSHLVKHFGKDNGLGGKNVDDITKDGQGRVWVALHRGGIAEIDPETFTIQFLNGNPAINDVVGKSLLVDDRGNIWVGTDKGAFVANLKNKTLTSISTPQGLISENITDLLQHDNHVYASTNKGVSVITLPEGGIAANKHLKIESYGAAYRIVKKNTGFFLTDMVAKDGFYWWGDEGITELKLTKQDTLRLTAFITGMNIMSEPTHFIDQQRFETNRSDTLWGAGDVHYLKGQKPENTGYETPRGVQWSAISGPHQMPVDLHLAYDQNFLQFQYGSLDLSRNESASYKYVLIGADKQWSETTTDPYSKNYFNLKAGRYTFEVSRLNRNGLWSKPAQLSFTITPPWWLTWWAWILYALLLFGTIYLFAYYRSLQLIKEKRVLEYEVHRRTEQVMSQKEEIEAQRDDLEQAVKELKLMQSQLVQSEKLASLGELTAGIAHEIQNPLNFVNNFAEVSIELVNELKEEHDKEAREPELENEILTNLEQNLQKINLHGKRADGIVKNMLQHSRNNSSERYLTDINALADEYMRLSYHGLRAKDKNFNSAMTTHFDSSLPKINIVPQDIGRVLLNLYNNAFYAVTHKKKTAGPDYKPEISVTTYSKNNQVVITVRDNGNGIPENIKDKIMQPFFTTKPTGEGTGLGLSLSYDMVVKGHGGIINIESVEGEFTEFTVQLPVLNNDIV